MKKLRDVLLSECREEIIKIAEKHGAYHVRIFGSVARGEEKENSDIDLLIDYDLNRITPHKSIGMSNNLLKLYIFIQNQHYKNYILPRG
ncbi:MAG: nucleotidyltransferase domain-containing protein [Cyanobacterium sp. T60_A2020_053]|nr:nucleotidyltransferase domain-containing protein [Cyanobacterium sp. T60_A2020_053]